MFFASVYENPKLKVVICQQRAPLFKGKRNQFVNVLVDFIKAEHFRETICLTSSHAYERLDSQLTGTFSEERFFLILLRELVFFFKKTLKITRYSMSLFELKRAD